ncbi:MAG: class I tRNA ligase family protein, partial [Methanomicrobia archaeon]|nr:class I tRNA ligase family protein [Methanomicrobia archaeon]
DEKGEAMHKSKGNAIPPEEVIEKYGRDTFRFYLLWAVAPWEDIRVSWEKIQSVNRMLKILWNVYKFSTTYMVLDNFDPETKYGDIEAHLRIEDRWMLSKINSLTKDLLGVWDTFYFHKITRPLYDFIVDDLSRWYIKLVRSRTWIEKDDPDKRAAYFVLCHALKTLSKLMAPITPYISEAVFTNMENKESVHLTDYPKYEERLIDSELNEQMNITRKIVESTAFARQKAEIKLRWPVSEIVIDSDDEGIKKAIEQFEDILLEQTNSKKIVLEKREFQYKLIPNYKIIGPKLKQDAEKVVTLLEKIDGKVLHDALEKGDFKIDTFVITKEDVDFELLPPEGYEFVSSDIGNVFVNKTIDAELKKEAYTREVVRRIQQMRKEMDLNIEDYIKTSLKCRFDLDESYIKRETRTESLAFKEGKGYYKKWEIDSEDVEIWIEA